MLNLHTKKTASTYMYFQSGRVLFELADCSLTLVYRWYQRGAASEEVMTSVSE